MIDPYDSYKVYNALRLHFTSDSYDALKYNFKTNITPSAFFKRKDKYFFAKIAKNYDKDMIQYYVSNFIQDITYVGEMVNEDGERNFKRFKKVHESLTKVFQDDINKLSDQVKMFDDLIISTDGQHPLIIQLWMQEEITLETVVILDSYLGFMDRESKKISDTIIWPDIKRKIEKYRPFVNFDVDKFKNILLKRFTNA